MDEESTWFCPFRVFDVLIESDDIGHDVIRVSADYMWAYYIDRWSNVWENGKYYPEICCERENSHG